MNRRRFIYCAATGLMVPYARALVPIPIGFFKGNCNPSGAAILALNDWIGRVQAQGSNVTIVGTQTAVGCYIDGLMTDGLWTKILRMSIYAGDDLNALKAPLKPGGDFDLLDTLTNFDAGDYAQNTGLTGNGTDESVLTGTGMAVSPIGQDDVHMACYCRTSDNAGFCMGTQNSGTGNADFLAPSDGSGTSYCEISNFTTGLISVADMDGVGMYIGTRTSSSSIVIYKNGTSIVSGAGAGGALITGRVAVHAMTSAGAAINLTARTIEMYSLGSGFSSTDAVNFTARYATLRAALGR